MCSQSKPITLFTELEKKSRISIRRTKDPDQPKQFWAKRNNDGDIAVPGFKFYYRDVVTKTNTKSNATKQMQK